MKRSEIAGELGEKQTFRVADEAAKGVSPGGSIGVSENEKEKRSNGKLTFLRVYSAGRRSRS